MSEPRKPANPFVRLYVHLSGIGGALSLAHLLEDFIAFKSFVLQLIQEWARFFVPFARWMFGWFTENVSMDPAVAAVVEQYFALGLIFAFGVARYFMHIPKEEGHWHLAFVLLVIALPLTAFLYLTLWPLLIVALTLGLLAEGEWEYLFALHSPLIYLVLLLVANMIASAL